VTLRLDPKQEATLQACVAALARRARSAGVTDQDVAEWLLSLAVRWLRAHGVTRENIHTWVNFELDRANKTRLSPLVAAAASPNDFGGGR